MKFLDLSVLLCLLAGNVISNEEEDSSRVKREYYSPPYSSQSPNPYNYPNPIYQPPNCKSAPACLSPNALPNQGDTVPRAWLETPRLFYLVSSTCWGYTFGANIFLGRPVYSWRELQEGCQTQFFSDNNTLILTGYGSQLIQNCTEILSPGTPRLDCLNTGGDPGIDNSLEVGEVDSLVASDGMSWALYYRCVDNHHGDYLLFSTRPYFTRRMLRQALPQIYALGFYPDEILALECYYPTYLVPFQNYPVPDTILSKFGTCPSNPFQNGNYIYPSGGSDAAAYPSSPYGSHNPYHPPM